MNPLLALVYLKRMAKNGVFGYDNELAIETAIEAVKKQIPKKPEIIACDEKKRYHCSCGKTLFIKYTGGGCHGNKAKYCDKCGQAIDWKEGGEE